MARRWAFAATFFVAAMIAHQVLTRAIDQDSSRPPPTAITAARQFDGCMHVFSGPLCLVSPSTTARAVSVVPAGAKLDSRVASGGLAIDPADPTAGDQAFARLPSAAEEERPYLLFLAGREHFRHGAAEEARRTLSEAIEAADRQGQSSVAARARWRLAHDALERHRVLEAAKLLENIHLVELGWAEGHVLQRFYEAVLARATLDYSSAIAKLREAVNVGRAFATPFVNNVEAELALTFSELGDSRQAERVHQRLLSENSLDPCGRALALGNVVSFWILAHEDRGAVRVPAEIESNAREAEQLWREACPHGAQGRAGALVDLALLALSEHDFDRAKRILAEIDEQAVDDAVIATWIEIARARLEKDPRRWRALIDRAEESRELASAWRAWMGLATLHEDRGELQPALAGFRRAEELADSLASVLPVAGRGQRITRQDASASALVDLLARSGRAAEALEVARRARRRVLAGLGSTDRIAGLDPRAKREWLERWSAYDAARHETEETRRRLRGSLSRRDRDRSVAQLAEQDARAEAALSRAFAVLDRDPRSDRCTFAATTPEGEAWWFWFPGRSHWWAFSMRGSEVTAHRVDDISTAEAARAPLLRSAAARVRLFPYGAVQELDLHAGVDAQVVYGADLGECGEDHSERASAQLFVGDPDGSLPDTAGEAERAAERSGAPRDALLIGARATRDEVRRRLATAEYFHFTGHAVRGGGEGLSGHLVLADGALTAGDILSSSRAPSRAVLLACSSADAAGEGAPGWGVAQALLRRGSDVVLGASRPVGERTASALSRVLYEKLSAGVRFEDATNAALRELAKTSPGEDWAAFRTLVR